MNSEITPQMTPMSSVDTPGVPHRADTDAMKGGTMWVRAREHRMRETPIWPTCGEGGSCEAELVGVGATPA